MRPSYATLTTDQYPLWDTLTYQAILHWYILSNDPVAPRWRWHLGFHHVAWDTMTLNTFNISILSIPYQRPHHIINWDIIHGSPGFSMWAMNLKAGYPTQLATGSECRRYAVEGGWIAARPAQLLQNSTAQCSHRFAGIHFRLFNFAAEQLHKHTNVHSAPHWLAPFCWGVETSDSPHSGLRLPYVPCLHTIPSQEIHMLFCSNVTSQASVGEVPKGFLTKLSCFLSAIPSVHPLWSWCWYW